MLISLVVNFIMATNIHISFLLLHIFLSYNLNACETVLSMNNSNDHVIFLKRTILCKANIYLMCALVHTTTNARDCIEELILKCEPTDSSCWMSVCLSIV